MRFQWLTRDITAPTARTSLDTGWDAKYVGNPFYWASGALLRMHFTNNSLELDCHNEQISYVPGSSLAGPACGPTLYLRLDRRLQLRRCARAIGSAQEYTALVRNPCDARRDWRDME